MFIFSAECRDGFTFLRDTCRCYMLILTPLVWSDIVIRCNKNESIPASLETVKKHTAVANFIRSRSANGQ